MIRNQRGFTLTNIFIGIALVVAIVGGVNYWNSTKAKDNARRIAKEQGEAVRDRFINLLRLDAAWKNTLAAAENVSMECLRSHKPCPHSNPPMILRDGMNRAVYDSINPKNGITLEGTNCGNFVETGNDNCPFRLDLNWNPQCDTFDDCLDPPSVIFTARIRFRASPNGPFAGLKIPDVTFEESRLVVPGVLRNCYEHLKRGAVADGLYVIQPSREGPAMSVYCDQTHDGGGWA
ncbi:MAG: fibrinogen-like YCDxxxxGGGW domain-containing protein, partial [Bdellovibrionota bacterium]